MRIFDEKSKKIAGLALGLGMAASTIMMSGAQIANASGVLVPDTGLTMSDSATVSPVDAFLPKVTIPADVTGNWASTYITDMVALGVFKGYPDNTFKPSKSVTRAEFSAAAERILNLPSPEEAAELKDVSETFWGFKSIQKVLPYLPIYADGSFRPNAPATREDIAAALVMATGLDKMAVDPSTVDVIFKDAKGISPDLKPLIAIAVNQKLVKGYKVVEDGGWYNDGTNDYNLYFKPQNFVTRAETSYLLDNARINSSLGFKVKPATGEE